MTDKTEKVQAPPRKKSIDIAPEDLVAMCGCRKVTMHVKNGKADLRNLEQTAEALQSACVLACGCRVILVNTRKVAND